MMFVLSRTYFESRMSSKEAILSGSELSRWAALTVAPQLV
jgi:hypothetical protein